MKLRKKFLLVGNPNTGKSTLFNRLTGLKQKVSNYPGVTVEKKTGSFVHQDQHIDLIDLPGTYSLIPHSADEVVAVQQICHPDENIDGIVIVADSTNLERNLYLVTQIIDCGLPTYLVLNMSDELIKHGLHINTEELEQQLGIPVVLTSAQNSDDFTSLKNFLLKPSAPQHLLGKKIIVSEIVKQHVLPISNYLSTQDSRSPLAEALRVVCREDQLDEYSAQQRQTLNHLRHAAQEQLHSQGLDWRALESELRFQWIHQLVKKVVRQVTKANVSTTEKIDRVALHHVFAPIIFLVLMGVIFQAIFSWASVPMNLIDSSVQWISSKVAHILPNGLLKSFVVDGIFAGVGSVLIFVPQIALLFFFISILEDSGYLSRASFVMDKMMRKLGLHGKAFIPLMSSFACAIPGIMATRTIESKRDRLVTMMIVPLMSCSARLPVYVLLIAACIPSLKIFGLFNVQGLVMWGLYLAGVLVALIIAWILKKSVL